MQAVYRLFLFCCFTKILHKFDSTEKARRNGS